jgi:hypothetical protein
MSMKSEHRKAHPLKISTMDTTRELCRCGSPRTCHRGWPYNSHFLSSTDISLSAATTRSPPTHDLWPHTRLYYPRSPRTATIPSNDMRSRFSIHEIGSREKTSDRTISTVAHTSSSTPSIQPSHPSPPQRHDPPNTPPIALRCPV